MDELIKWLREQIKEINSNEDFETGMIVAYGNVLYKIHEIKQKKQQHSEYPGIRFKDQKMANDIIKEQGIGFTAVHAEPYKQMAMYNALAHNAASVTNEPMSVYELGKQIHEQVEVELNEEVFRCNNCPHYSDKVMAEDEQCKEALNEEANELKPVEEPKHDCFNEDDFDEKLCQGQWTTFKPHRVLKKCLSCKLYAGNADEE